jgi:hypothetical protein
MSPKMSAWAVLAMAAVVCAAARADNIESPPYSVVHAESDFEIRLYRPSTWISTPVEDISFSKATQIGFHKYAPKPYPVTSYLLQPLSRMQME